MSGTSFDGVDAALIKTNGRNFIELIDTSYVEYSAKEKSLYIRTRGNGRLLYTKVAKKKKL